MPIARTRLAIAGFLARLSPSLTDRRPVGSRAALHRPRRTREIDLTLRPLTAIFRAVRVSHFTRAQTATCHICRTTREPMPVDGGTRLAPDLHEQPIIYQFAGAGNGVIRESEKRI